MKKMRIDLCFEKIKICLRFFHFELHLLRLEYISLFLPIAKTRKISDQQTDPNMKTTTQKFTVYKKRITIIFWPQFRKKILDSKMKSKEGQKGNDGNLQKREKLFFPGDEIEIKIKCEIIKEGQE